MGNKQFAALPFQLGKAELSVLLITTRRKGRWSISKGSPKPGEPQRTAETEAFEEAGLLRKVRGKAIGTYWRNNRKGKRKIACDVRLFPLKVRAQKRRWPERGQREVIWLPAKQASALVYKPALTRLIVRFARRKRRKSRNA
ncbi:NUDIX hydrolase [Bradyrhizobium rifense]|uniref:NUDIX hydrolase n=1 Tax=Bradyrhizobium rifense TaxID=515499 RepID=A0A5D3KPX6_9BRAD|nr:NUDIX hydrolase [Bradyrhizobium rifense]TYM00155.1 NUDIX hydrolase [Bradyrhizobium rifense]